MKKLFTIFVLLSLTINVLRAQITITQSNFPYVERAIYQNADSATVPGFSTINTSLWDLGSIQKLGDVRGVTYTQINNHAVFATATEVSQAWQLFGPLPIAQQIFRQKTASGYSSLGIGYQEQKIGLGFLSGNNPDTITFPTQTYSFSAPYQEFKFPLTEGTQWSAATFSHTDFFLDLFLFGYNHSPCALNNYFAAQHEAIAYGTCRVPAKGAPGNTFPVLLLKSALTRVDSFYIDNAPADPFLLGALGVTQGDTIRTYQYRILRENGGTQELAIIEFEDDSYSTVKKAEYSAEFDALSVGNITIEKAVTVYPNPSNGSRFTVTLPQDMQGATFIITDAGGKQTQATVYQQSSTQYALTPAQQLAAGIYLLQIQTNTKTAIIKLIVK
jgi:hypothetical protein